jgi:hypothetical protein
VEADTPAARAMASVLLQRKLALPALASRLDGEEVVFVLRGGSMLPSIPSDARFRIRLGRGLGATGSIVLFATDSDLTVHRVAYRPARGRGASYLLTLGDNCLAPDPPVLQERIVGTVIAVEVAGRWQAPGPTPVRSVCHRLVRAISLATAGAALWLSPDAAGGLARALMQLERGLRAPVGRALRRLHAGRLLR